MNKVLEKIEAIKEKVSDNEYLEIMDALKADYDTKNRPPTWSDLLSIMEDDGIIDNIPHQIQYRLDITDAEELPLILAKTIQGQAKMILNLQNVILDQAIKLSEAEKRARSLSDMFSW